MIHSYEPKDLTIADVERAVGRKFRPPMQVEWRWQNDGRGWEVRVLDMDDQPLSEWTRVPADAEDPMPDAIAVRGPAGDGDWHSRTSDGAGAAADPGRPPANTSSTADAMAVLAALVDATRHPEAVRALRDVRAEIERLRARIHKLESAGQAADYFSEQAYGAQFGCA